jgi:D-aminoacyl-tRNA deacylase
MRIVLQRVKQASVQVEGQVTGAIQSGLLLLIGIGKLDTEKDADYLAEKTLALRIFPDAEGKMNRSLVEAQGAILAVSQFTLYGDCRKGRRPSFDDAAPPAQAQSLYDYFVQQLRARGAQVETGIFRAHMEVNLTNDGPVTLLYDSERKF